MNDNVLQSLEKVCDAPTFLSFLDALRGSIPGTAALHQKTTMQLYHAGLDGWMNHDLSSFLEAAVAGGQDNKVGANAATIAESWRAAAEIIYCGKVYE